MNHDKSSLRQEMRRRLAAERLPLIDQVAVDRVRQLPEWQAASSVLLFSPLDDEVDIRPLFDTTAGGRRILVPRLHDVHDGEMEAVLAPSPPPRRDAMEETAVPRPVEGWSRRRWGIWEHAGEPVLAPAALAEIGFALVPGLAFSRDGGRLGRGKGYYDRFLARLGPACFKCGIGFDFQLVEDLPTQPHDVPLDAVVTPGGVYRRTDWLGGR